MAYLIFKRGVAYEIYLELMFPMYLCAMMYSSSSE